MQKLLIIFVGGGLGSIARYLISKAIKEQFISAFPWSTFTVNIVGCFLIGIFISLVERYRLNPIWSLLLATGFCGGFTTFSSFAYENYALLKEEDYLIVFVYSMMSILWGLAATFLAFWIVRKI
jgi:CrcB protein